MTSSQSELLTHVLGRVLTISMAMPPWRCPRGGVTRAEVGAGLLVLLLRSAPLPPVSLTRPARGSSSKPEVQPRDLFPSGTVSSVVRSCLLHPPPQITPPPPLSPSPLTLCYLPLCLACSKSLPFTPLDAGLQGLASGRSFVKLAPPGLKSFSASCCSWSKT